MWINIVLLAAVAGYAFWVIRRKVRKFKAGEYCDCGCGSCGCPPGQCSKKNNTKNVD